MGRIGGPDARTVAAVASLAAAAVLVLLVLWHPPGLPTVALALLGVLLAMAAGTSVTAARQRGRRPERDVVPPDSGPPGVDADTLEALDSAAVRAGSIGTPPPDQRPSGPRLPAPRRPERIPPVVDQP